MVLQAVRENILENLSILQAKLENATDRGMLDLDDYYYNELLGLIDESNLAKAWEELEEVIYKAKTIETDIDAWLSQRGYTTISLEWPSNLDDASE